MQRAFPLAVVLALRQQKEAAEERALMAIGARINEIRLSAGRLQQEIAKHSEARANEVQTVQSAAQHQAFEARWRALRQLQSELEKQLGSLEAKRLEQQKVFLAARRDREMLTELQGDHKAAWDAKVQAAEQKLVADAFAARRARYKH